MKSTGAKRRKKQTRIKGMYTYVDRIESMKIARIQENTTREREKGIVLFSSTFVWVVCLPLHSGNETF